MKQQLLAQIKVFHALNGAVTSHPPLAVEARSGQVVKNCVKNYMKNCRVQLERFPSPCGYPRHRTWLSSTLLWSATPANPVWSFGFLSEIWILETLPGIRPSWFTHLTWDIQSESPVCSLGFQGSLVSASLQARFARFPGTRLWVDPFYVSLNSLPLSWQRAGQAKHPLAARPPLSAVVGGTEGAPHSSWSVSLPQNASPTQKANLWGKFPCPCLVSLRLLVECQARVHFITTLLQLHFSSLCL